MTTRFNFSYAIVRDLQLPQVEGKRDTYKDTVVPGLELRVTKSGVKTFYVSRWSASRKQGVRVCIGRFPDISIPEARRLAQRTNADFAAGIDPNEQKRAIREEMTLRELFNLCLEQDFKPHNRTWKKYEQIFEGYCSSFATRRLTTISYDFLQDWHARIGEQSGRYAANRALRLISTLYSRAKVRGFAGSNPAKGIKYFREESRSRFLEAEELRKFTAALNEYGHKDFRDFIYVCLYTAARQSNVLQMRWDQIHWEQEQWEIPRTKNDTSQRVPLIPYVLSILRTRVDIGSEWVFPASIGSGCMQVPRKQWRKFLEKADLSNLRLHDLRRTLGSWLAATGASLTIIGKSLNHKSLKATQVYARLDLDPVKEAIERATSTMLQTAGLATNIKSVGSVSKAA